MSFAVTVTPSAPAELPPSTIVVAPARFRLSSPSDFTAASAICRPWKFQVVGSLPSNATPDV